MTDKYFAVPQGKLYIAERNSLGQSGGFRYLGDSDGFTLNTAQQFLDIQESYSGNRTNAAHLITQTDLSVQIDVLNVDAANLALAYYGDVITAAAGTVSGEAAKAYLGKTIPLKYGNVSSVVVKKGATTIAATEYKVNAAGGSIDINTNAAGLTDGDSITIDYSHTGGSRMRSLTQDSKDYILYFEGKSKFDNKAQKATIHKVVLDLSKAMSFISTGVNKLTLSGKALPASEIVNGESQYYTHFQE